MFETDLSDSYSRDPYGLEPGNTDGGACHFRCGLRGRHRLGAGAAWTGGWHTDLRLRIFGSVCLRAYFVPCYGGSNPHVISAGVVTGVGFLGAGVILREQGRIVGLTTAATLWSTASVGLAIAYGMYTLGLLTTLIMFTLLSAHHLPRWNKLKSKNKNNAPRSE